MGNEYDYDFSTEAELTNKQLAVKLAMLSTLSVNQINRLLPNKTDKVKLDKLINIVNKSASEQDSITSLRTNFAELGGVVLRLIKIVI